MAQPKAARRGFGAPKEPLRVFEESPVTGQKIQLLEGRYGPYLNDGVTNASLPKGTAPDTLTREQALELLAARAALGPSTPKRGRRAGSGAKSKRAPRPAAASERPGDNGATKPAGKPAKRKAPAKKKPAARGE